MPSFKLPRLFLSSILAFFLSAGALLSPSAQADTMYVTLDIQVTEINDAGGRAAASGIRLGYHYGLNFLFDRDLPSYLGYSTIDGRSFSGEFPLLEPSWVGYHSDVVEHSLMTSLGTSAYNQYAWLTGAYAGIDQLDPSNPISFFYIGGPSFVFRLEADELITLSSTGASIASFSQDAYGEDLSAFSKIKGVGTITRVSLQAPGPLPPPVPGDTPEPGTMLLFGSATGVLAWWRWRKKSF